MVVEVAELNIDIRHFGYADVHPTSVYRFGGCGSRVHITVELILRGTVTLYIPVKFQFSP